MSNADDTKMINESPAEAFRYSTSDDEKASGQRCALLKWVENFIKKQLTDDFKAEFWRVVSTVSTEEFIDKYFPRGSCTADCRKLV